MQKAALGATAAKANAVRIAAVLRQGGGVVESPLRTVVTSSG